MNVCRTFYLWRISSVNTETWNLKPGLMSWIEAKFRKLFHEKNLITNDYTSNKMGDQVTWKCYRSRLRKRATIRNFGGQNFRNFVLPERAFVLTGSMDVGCGFYKNSLIGHTSSSGIAIHLLVERDWLQVLGAVSRWKMDALCTAKDLAFQCGCDRNQWSRLVHCTTRTGCRWISVPLRHK